MSEERKQYPIDKMLAEISARREDRGFLAELRRGLNPVTEEQAWPYIAQYAKSGFADETIRRVWATIGGVAATLVSEGLMRVDGFASVGNAMRRIKEGEPSLGDSGIKSYEAKFRRILNSPNALDLCGLVSEVGRNAARKGVEMNCCNLYWDLSKWDDPEDREKIRVRWARDFYGVFAKKDEDTSGSKEESDE